MSEELKLCPYCGKAPTHFPGFSICSCDNAECVLGRNEISFVLEDWQTRPIEDDLLNKLHKAEERYISLQKQILSQSRQLEVAKEVLEKICGDDETRADILADEALNKLEAGYDIR